MTIPKEPASRSTARHEGCQRKDPNADPHLFEPCATIDATVARLCAIPGVGDLSYTHCALQIARVLSHRKRARILYVSDFDPSGARMPIGAARKIEYLIRRDQHDVDVRLDPVVLTADQVRRFALPRSWRRDGRSRRARS